MDSGARVVGFPGFDQRLSVVVAGFAEKPLMLLTTFSVTRWRKSLWRVVESYLARWRIEETIRFYALADGIKQLFFGRHSGIGEPRPDPNGPETLLLPLRL